MADALLGEIRLFAGDFGPAGWMLCEGQRLPIARYPGLFRVLGVNYGGNGSTDFALPDLRGAAPLGQGHGPGLSFRSLGETGGAGSVALTQDQMPAHSHLAAGVAGDGDSHSPTNAVWARHSAEGCSPDLASLYAPKGGTAISPTALQPSGQGAPHNNMQPYLPLHFIICTEGAVPPRP